jgi:hypothetical protein
MAIIDTYLQDTTSTSKTKAIKAIKGNMTALITLRLAGILLVYVGVFHQAAAGVVIIIMMVLSAQYNFLAAKGR